MQGRRRTQACNLIPVTAFALVIAASGCSGDPPSERSALSSSTPSSRSLAGSENVWNESVCRDAPARLGSNSYYGYIDSYACVSSLPGAGNIIFEVYTDYAEMTDSISGRTSPYCYAVGANDYSYYVRTDTAGSCIEQLQPLATFGYRIIDS